MLGKDVFRCRFRLSIWHCRILPSVAIDFLGE